MKLLILYHYYHPDDVVSARQFRDLCEGLADRGSEVEVWTGNRACHDPSISYSPKSETVNGVKISRFWRPGFNQHSFLGRVLNSIWLQKYWFFKLLFTPSLKPDVILIGTDPLFHILSMPYYKLIRPKAKLVHWAFDLYPEAAIADGLVGENSLVVKFIRFFLKKSYASCDLIADLGPCMKEVISRYGERVVGSQLSVVGQEVKPGLVQSVTLTPWALEEPAAPLVPDPAERHLLFAPPTPPPDGKGSDLNFLNFTPSLGLLYSGSFGRAHEFNLTLSLARKLRGSDAAFAYGVRGSRLAELKNAITPEDTNIRFVDFAPPDKLEARLSAPDIHIVTLREPYTGAVVPSKFFGALAAGRPVLFEGSDKCSIAHWINEYKVGWHLRSDNLDQVAADLEDFGKDAVRKQVMFKHCHDIYHTHFSKGITLNRWNNELRHLI